MGACFNGIRNTFYAPVLKATPPLGSRLNRNMDLPIYLDYNATTPVDERVFERMRPYFTEQYGNASSQGHALGWAADEAVEQAREQTAAFLEADDPRTVTLTSGATEALNLGIKGVARAYARSGKHLVTVRTEHKAVLGAHEALEHEGFDVTRLPVDENGCVDPADVEHALTDDTTLVSVMWSNNETGVLHPIPEIYDRLQAHDALLLTDATQAIGKVPVGTEHCDLLALSGHKVYGPKGGGALYASRRRPRVRLVPLIDGGGQEAGRRGGTLNTPAIVGLGAALETASEEREDDAQRLTALRDEFEQRLTGALPDVQVNGGEAERLPNTSNVTFRGLTADDLMTRMRGVAVSTGSACQSAAGEPSHVLKAHGLSDEEARATVRFSLGRPTTKEEISHVADQVVEGVQALRPASAHA